MVYSSVKHFMSLNATLMYAAKRTYPEISFPVVYLAWRHVITKLLKEILRRLCVWPSIL